MDPVRVRRPLRVVMLSHNCSGVGGYRRHLHHSLALARRGHRVTLLTLSPGRRPGIRRSFKQRWLGEAGRPEGEGPWVEVVETPSLDLDLYPGGGGGPLDLAFRVGATLAARPDLVIGSGYHPNATLPGLAARFRCRAGFLLDWQDWFGGGEMHGFRGNPTMHRWSRRAEDRAYRRAQHVFVICRHLEARALSLGLPEGGVTHAPEGCDLEFVAVTSRAEARRRLGLDASAPLVVMGIDPTWPEALRAFAGAARRLPEARLVVIGREAPGLMAEAHQLGVAGRVLRPGWVPTEDYPTYLAAASVGLVVLAHRDRDRGREPATLLDLMAAGRAAVTTDVGDVPALCRRWDAGWVMPEVEAVEAGLVEALTRPELAAQRGGRARQVAERERDWRVLGERFAVACEGVAQRLGRARR